MPRNPEAILIDALQLPQQERAELASILIRSLDEHIDEGVDEEIAEKLKEIDEGKMEMIPYEQVMDEVDAMIREHRDAKADNARRRPGYWRERVETTT